MSSKQTRREALIKAAIQLLDAEGPEALQTRRITAEAGSSTMAVYTHFGGMRELVRELAAEGFRRLDAALTAVPRTDSPVEDLKQLGLAYRAHALAGPHLYRLMFGVTAPAGQQVSIQDAKELDSGKAAFEHLTEGARRLIDAGIFRAGEAEPVAGQLWSAVHGYVLLELAGHFTDPEEGIATVLLPLMVNLGVGLATEESTITALFGERFSPGAGN